VADSPITFTGPEPAPFRYTLSGFQRFTPMAVTATFDGSAAAGPFLPSVAIYAQAGQLLGRMFPQVLQPGDVAEVTFSPFSRPAASAGAGGWQLIQEIECLVLTPFVTFAAIPQTFRHLMVVMSAASPNSSDIDLAVKWAGAVNYSGMALVAEVPPTPNVNYSPKAGSSVVLRDVLTVAGSVSGAHNFGGLVLTFPYYSRTDRVKTVIWEATKLYLAAPQANSVPEYGSGGGQSASSAGGSDVPITDLTLDPIAEQFVPGSVMSLYGL
jgi:hypothetical protein